MTRHNLAKLIEKHGLPGLQTEADFQQQIQDLATTYKWRFHHVYDSRKCVPGFPDLCAVRGKFLLFVELKRIGEKPTPDQEAWLRDLSAVEIVQTQVWTPADWHTAVDVLSGGLAEGR